MQNAAPNRKSEQRRENPMSKSTPETIRLTGEPAVCSTDLFSGWWVVYRLWNGGSGTCDYGKIAVAAFPQEAMAREWISEAPHRSRDFTEPLNDQAHT